MMNKTILAALAAAAALSLGSCAKTTEVVAPSDGLSDGIGFRTFLGATPRAAEYSVASSMKTDGFNVLAFGNNAQYFSDTAKPETATPDGTGKWETQTGSYVWPGFKLDFYAYANLPTDNTATINTTKKEISLKTQDKVADQKDAVVAYKKEATKEVYETSGAPLYFKHILSQVTVEAKDANQSTHPYKIEVAGVKIGHVNSVATFTFPDATTAEGTALASSLYTNGGTAKDFVAGSSSIVELTSTAQTIMNSTNGNFMLIPQDLTAWDPTAQWKDENTDGTNDVTSPAYDNGVFLGVLVRIKTTGGAAIYPTDGTKFAFATTPLNIDKFEPGKKYKITVDFANGAGFEEPAANTVSPTDLPTGVTVNNSPITPATPGKPILGGPIKFTVTVQDWADGGTTEVNMTPAE